MAKAHTNQDEFIALASHQLRTPATAVKQYLAMLMDGYAGKLTKQQRDFVRKAYESNERQLSTINDLLHVAQIDADAIILDAGEVNLVPLVADIVNEQRRITTTRKQQIVVDMQHTGELTVWADTLRLRMAIDNLVDNASKYASEDSTITVTIGSDNDMATVAVQDTGVGIAKADFPRLFQKFSRINNPRSILVGGTGLGLYLARRIVDAHNGNIELASEVGRGTVFTVRLPVYNKGQQV